jgi:Cu+-exporting ATPase
VRHDTGTDSGNRQLKVKTPNSQDMTRRFWIGAALAVPVFVLAMAQLIPSLGLDSWVIGVASQWIQFELTVPVVCWAGWPFFQRGCSPS